MNTTKRKNGNDRKVGYKHYVRILRKHKKNLYERYKVSEIGIFGSYVRGEQKLQSDIDILVDFSEVPGLLEFISLENHLRDILKKKVDLVDKKGIRQELRDIILNEVVYV